jgi:hypothetical protein
MRTDEMIGVVVLRKACSASVKRTQESLISGGDNYNVFSPAPVARRSRSWPFNTLSSRGIRLSPINLLLPATTGYPTFLRPFHRSLTSLPWNYHTDHLIGSHEQCNLAGIKFRRIFLSETNDVIFDKRIRDKPAYQAWSSFSFSNLSLVLCSASSL